MNPVTEFAATGVAIKVRSAQEVEKERVVVTATRASLFAIETQAASILDKRLRDLGQESKFAGTTYKRLSLEPLKWHRPSSDKVDWPIFAIYSLVRPGAQQLVSDRERAYTGSTGLPEPGNLPDPIANIYVEHRRRLKEGHIRSVFQGMIPAPVREKINEAKTSFEGSALFIIAEADWQKEIAPVPLRRDPLVVGWDGHSLWLVAHFDLTDVEDYLIKEFPG